MHVVTRQCVALQWRRRDTVTLHSETLTFVTLQWRRRDPVTLHVVTLHLVTLQWRRHATVTLHFAALNRVGPIVLGAQARQRGRVLATREWGAAIGAEARNLTFSKSHMARGRGTVRIIRRPPALLFHPTHQRGVTLHFVALDFVTLRWRRRGSTVAPRILVQGAGFRVQGAGFRVQGLGCKGSGLGFGVYVAHHRPAAIAHRLQLRVFGAGFRV